MITETFEYIVSQLIKKSSCGKLDVKERDAVRILRKYLKENNADR